MIALPQNIENRVRDFMFTTDAVTHSPDLFDAWLKLRVFLKTILETSSVDPALADLLLNKWCLSIISLWQQVSKTNGLADYQQNLVLCCCDEVERLRESMVAIIGHSKTEYTVEQLTLARRSYVSNKELALLAYLKLSTTEMGIVFGFLLTTKLPVAQLSPRQWMPHSDSQFEQRFAGFVFTFERIGQNNVKLLMVRREKVPLIPLVGL